MGKQSATLSNIAGVHYGKTVSDAFKHCRGTLWENSQRRFQRCYV